jgi:hypothetical protein
MAYKPEQLPFIGYAEWVQELKKAHDMEGGGYPLFIEVFDGQDQKLIEEVIKNVYDRNSEPQIVATDDWSAPVIARMTEQRVPATVEVPFEDEIRVQDRVPSDQLDVSALFTDEESAQWKADLKKSRRQDAAVTKRREKELKAEIERKNAN